MIAGHVGWADLPFWTEDYPAIQARLATETGPIYPPEEARFRALTLCQPEACKVVIIGQDPYHTPGKADGLAFSIPRDFGGRLDSLGNIFKEIEADLQVKREVTNLDDWAEQGVLLLNTALSVPEGQAKAHAKYGWDRLVRQVIGKLESSPRAFLLWGNPAKAFAPKSPHHLVLTSAHPSPLSASRGFFGSRPFSKVNRWLTDQGKEPINWADPT